MKSRAQTKHRKGSQSRFADDAFKIDDKFGGSLCNRRQYRKARPISTRETMHLILKSSIAKGRLSFRHVGNAKKIEEIIQANCVKFGVRLITFSNNFNHLHLQVKFTSRELYKRFVRAVAGHIAIAVTGASKSRPLVDCIGARKFWDARPYSRIARGRRGFATVRDYVRLNQLEAEGIMPKRGERLRGLRPGERVHFRECSREPFLRTVELEQLDFFGN